MSQDNQQQTQAQQWAMISELLGKKGGFDASSTLGDPFAAFGAGVYQPPPQKSDQQYYAEFAPDFQNVLSSADAQGYHVYVVTELQRGASPWQIKANLRGRFPELFADKDKTLASDASDFISDMAKQRDAVVKAKADDAGALDPFQKQGLPGFKQQYTPQDIIGMDPQRFTDLQGKIDSSTLDTNERMKQLLASNPQFNQTFQKSASGDVRDDLQRNMAGVGSVFADGQKRSAIDVLRKIEAQDFNKKRDAQMDKNKTPYLSDFLQNFNRPGRAIDDIIGSAGQELADWGNKVTGTEMDQSEIVKILSKRQGVAGKRVEDTAATSRQASMNDYLRSIVARMTGQSQATSNAVGSLTQLRDQLAADGRSPLSDALLSVGKARSQGNKTKGSNKPGKTGAQLVKEAQATAKIMLGK